MRAECSIPLRNFLGSDHGLDVARSCGQMRVAWVFGACTVIALGLFFAHYQTAKIQQQYNDGEPVRPSVVVPLWLCWLPIGVAIYTFFTAESNAENFWKTEQLYFQTTGMTKENFLNLRIPDDRLAKTTGSSLLGTGGIVGAAILGPWARGDNR